MVDLSFDVLQMVVDELGSEAPPDFATLETLSQTCRYLLPLCRRHIFFSVWPHTRIMGSNLRHPAHASVTSEASNRCSKHIGVENLSKLLESSPEIAGYIRELKLYPHPSNSDDDMLLQFLQRVDRLQKLIIAHFLFATPFFRFQNWGSLPSPLQEALFDLVRRQRYTLKHLVIADHTDIPMSIIFPSTCLHSLHLIDSYFSATAIAEDAHGIFHPRPLEMRTMAFTSGYHSVRSFFEGVRPGSGAPFFDLSGLRTFYATASGTGDEALAIAKLVKGMAQLKTVNISCLRHSIPVNMADILNAIHPSSFSTILTLSVQTWYTDFYNLSLLQLPSVVLRKVTRPFRSLKNLIISFSVQFPIPDDLAQSVTADFKELDNFIVTKYLQLESLAIFPSFYDVNTTNDGTNDLGLWLNIPNLMPRSSANPALRYSFTSKIVS
ncbi:hypothetical protein BDN70DRAFT_996695 [Pholiota conissans]|uniref:Uncharacterized protein n=1 Tax=Pholiota conissans TaxID=109636 RepID=A0A9P5YUM4_9AGAR|nr:hypothetical protein BDN70DRAFT_996695 [Pholiota conissans]